MTGMAGRLIMLGLAALALATGAAALSPVAVLPSALPPYATLAETRAAIRTALQQRQAAEVRSTRLEQDAAAARNAAERTARQAAALAARIQQAEAGVAAAEARMALVDRERALLREQLGHEQGPLVRLTAALQQISRRPAALALLRPGTIEDVARTRALLASAMPQVNARTAALRRRIDRSHMLREQARQAVAVLGNEQQQLTSRQRELAALETRQRLASREAIGSADREAERALALAEQARDLDALVGDLGRAASLRAQLAALPGPMLRPGISAPAISQPAAAPVPVADPATDVPPRPYLLPVLGRMVSGFGSPRSGGVSKGLSLAPAAGAQVVVPAAGRVAYAGPYRGYGRIVIVEHAGGWTSLITGLARVDVRVGQQLVGGAPIGVVPRSRPVVTLELRHGSDPVDPLPFVG